MTIDDEGRVTRLLDETARTVDVDAAWERFEQRSARDGEGNDRRDAPAPVLALRHDRPAGSRVLASAAAVVLVVGAAVLVALASSGGETTAKTPNAADQGTATSASAARPSSTVGPDIYDVALNEISGAAVFPSTRPTDLRYVLVQALNGGELLRLGFDRYRVEVCEHSPCGPGMTVLRSVEAGGSTYSVEAGPQPGNPTLSMPEAERQSWAAATFVVGRPAWLTLDLYPGVPPVVTDPHLPR